MQTSDILKRVRRIEIETGKLVVETFAGEYLSVFKGQGIEFAEVRQYIPGDDVRSIDWNVSARTGSTFVKKFNEERELSVIIACDISASQFFGSTGRFKSEAVAELGAVFAFSAIKNSDKVGLLLFSDKIELYIPPKKGKRHVLRIIRELLAFTPKSKGTDISLCLSTLNRLIKRQGILLLISDFLDSGYDKALRLSARKFDLVPVIVEDPLEVKLPSASAFLQLEGLEGGRQIMLGLNSPYKTELAAQHNAAIERAIKLFNSTGSDYIKIDASKNVVEDVIKFFKKRARKLRK
ncbi:MAG: DUF58 domain-containing protein [Elusimicrobiota bacterium]|jgi:uncharacterized protein (DUF58 family)|nr:DUF58 domain-containing protein [Elusimicrobiota bacterium]